MLVEKNKTLINSTEKFWNGSKFFKNFSSSQSFFIVWNQTQINDCCLRRNRIEGSCLSLKGQAKFLLRRQKLYQITNIFCNPLSSVFIQPFDTNLLAPRRTLGLQCIYRAQLIIQIAHIYYRLPCIYVTSLLAYCRGELRIKRCIYKIKVLLRYF